MIVYGYFYNTILLAYQLSLLHLWPALGRPHLQLLFRDADKEYPDLLAQ